MEILLVCEGITKSSIVAQPWKHVYELAKRMMDQGNDVKIVTNSLEMNNALEEEISGIQVIKVRKGKFLFKSEELTKCLNSQKAEVVNWHGSDPLSTANIWRMKKKLKKNVFWTLHSGPLSFGDLKNLNLREVFSLYKFWNNILNSVFPSSIIKKWMNVPQINHVITLSKRLKRFLVRKGIKNDNEVTIIRSGVDTNKFDPSNGHYLNEKLNLEKIEKSSETILYFGPLSRFRGVDTLLAAIPRVMKKVPSAKLLLLARGHIGDNQDKMLEKKARKSKGTVVIRGVLKEDRLINYLNLADVVVLPFKFWPQVECPLTLLESMSMQKPVITTSVGAIPEIISNYENGILVSPNKCGALAKAIIEVLNHRELALKIGRNARDYVSKFFDWNVIVNETLKVFDEAYGHL
jgi:glycosyltransferase involved in cell wall biosynthesis